MSDDLVKVSNGLVVVGTTLPAYVMRDRDLWGSWLANAEAMVFDHPSIRFFAAIEVDGRGIEPFQPLLERLSEIPAVTEHWTFSLDDGVAVITTKNRLRRITTGQNLVSDYCRSVGAGHLLFMAADCAPPGDAISKLLEVNHPLVGGEVSTYCLSGPPVIFYDDFPVEAKMATAAFVMLHHSVFGRIGWRWDPINGMTDDPCLEHDAKELLSIPTYVRMDVVGRHYPEQIEAIERRHTDAQRTIQRVAV